MKKEECYRILGLNCNDSLDDAKKQYKKLAMKYHPDKNKDEGAEQKFKEISEAYDCIQNNNFDRPSASFQRVNPFEMFSFAFGGQHPFAGSNQGTRMQFSAHMRGAPGVTRSVSRQTIVVNGIPITTETVTVNGETTTRVMHGTAPRFQK